jgi:hypothetical protein
MENKDRLDAFFHELHLRTLEWDGIPFLHLEDLAMSLRSGKSKPPDYFTLAPGQEDDVWSIPVGLLKRHDIPEAPGCDLYYTAYGDLCAGTLSPRKELMIFREDSFSWESLEHK